MAFFKILCEDGTEVVINDEFISSIEEYGDDENLTLIVTSNGNSYLIKDTLEKVCKNLKSVIGVICERTTKSSKK